MKNNKKGFTSIVIIIVLALGILGFGAYKVFYKATPTAEESMSISEGNFPPDYEPADHKNTSTALNESGNQNISANCGFSVTNISANQKVAFPLEVKGVIDNTNAKSTKCSWSMFEGQAGLAQLYVYDIDGKNTGWQPIGQAVPMLVKYDDWMSSVTPFNITVGNDHMGLKLNTLIKILFNEEDLSGRGEADTFELPLIYAGKSTSNTTGQFTKIKIALLGMAAKDGDEKRLIGCDLVNMVERTIPYTTTPLNAAMNELFAKKEPWPKSETYSGNFISSQKNLFFDKATLENGVARIYLTGYVTLAGECDDPRLETQINETAKQFSTVKSVEIFVSGKRWTTPSLKGE